MELAKLTKAECEQMQSLMERAIQHGQLEIRIQSIGLDGLEQHNGHGVSDFKWTVLSTITSGEEPVDPENEDGEWREYEQPEVHLFITDANAQYLAGNHSILQR